MKKWRLSLVQSAPVFMTGNATRWKRKRYALKSFQAWHSLNYADLGCVFTKPEKKEKVCKEIAGVMGEAMNRLYWNEADAKEFELLMFKFYCSTGSRDTINAISGLLHKYIKPACRELMKDDWQSW